MLPPIFKKFIQLLDSFPEIGPRQAWRLFFWLLRQEDKFKTALAETFRVVQEQTTFCSLCFFPTLNLQPTKNLQSTNYKLQTNLCDLCSNPKRVKATLCLVARETDLVTLEETKKYQGLYFVLGGLLLPYEEKELIRDRLRKFQERLQTDNKIKQVIIALPLTREAEPICQEIEKILKNFPTLKISKPRRGIPLGGEIEFMDPETLSEALFSE